MRTQIQKTLGSQVGAYGFKVNTKNEYDVLPTHIFIWISLSLSLSLDHAHFKKLQNYMFLRIGITILKTCLSLSPCPRSRHLFHLHYHWVGEWLSLIVIRPSMRTLLTRAFLPMYPLGREMSHLWLIYSLSTTHEDILHFLLGLNYICIWYI